jgi:hypothetical protein
MGPMADVEDVVPLPGQRVVWRNARRRSAPAVAVCSLATGTHRALLAESAVTMTAYGRRHGWDVVLSCEELAPERPASWSKLRLVASLLPHYDFVFWVDADAIIVDLDRDLLAEIDREADLWLARHPQDRDPHATVLNMGIFLARSAAFTRALIEALWTSEAFVDHNWWENAALLDLLGYSLEPPFARRRASAWEHRIRELDLAWNSVPGDCESPHPAINHHARSDHDDFARRLASMAADRAATVAAFPDDFPGRDGSTPVGRRRGRPRFTALPVARMRASLGRGSRRT